MDFRVKFFFADAQTIEETFPPSTTVADAKNKLIASWPEGVNLTAAREEFRALRTSGPKDSRLVRMPGCVNLQSCVPAIMRQLPQLPYG